MPLSPNGYQVAPVAPSGTLLPQRQGLQTPPDSASAAVVPKHGQTVNNHGRWTMDYGWAAYKLHQQVAALPTRYTNGGYIVYGRPLAAGPFLSRHEALRVRYLGTATPISSKINTPRCCCSTKGTFSSFQHEHPAEYFLKQQGQADFLAGPSLSKMCSSNGTHQGNLSRPPEQSWVAYRHVKFSFTARCHYMKALHTTATWRRCPLDTRYVQVTFPLVKTRASNRWRCKMSLTSVVSSPHARQVHPADYYAAKRSQVQCRNSDEFATFENVTTGVEE